jgi:putative hemolysin
LRSPQSAACVGTVAPATASATKIGPICRQFIEKVLEYFDFSYAVRSNERARIPDQGPVVIIANHPIGSLDGLALLRLVSEVRSDVKVVANELLMAIEPLHPLLLPVDNMGGQTARQAIRGIERHLRDGGALIIFPAGEVSRLSPAGVRDGRWHPSFLRFAKRAKATILPVYVDGRNSVLFYSLSMLAKPLSTLLLIREMFKQARNHVSIRIGRPVAPDRYLDLIANEKKLIKRFKKQVYQLNRARQKDLFAPGADVIAHPENRQLLRQEMRQCQLLGATRDGKKIYLYEYQADSVIMRELGRLREFTFRAVGEGTGQRRDTDRYDRWYQHILLWDDEDLELVGAYRLARAGAVLDQHGPDGLYSGSLFHFDGPLLDLLPETVELGRSFIQPRYWGLRGLDYLWYGIGAYLRRHPEVRYLMGPVSISNNTPPLVRDLLVCFYRHYFPAGEFAVRGRLPYEARHRDLREFEFGFSGDDYTADFGRLRAALQASGLQVPTLYKQYTESVEPGGARFLEFNVDPDFGHCVDGLILVDLARLRTSHRRRYLGDRLAPRAARAASPEPVAEPA